MPPTSIVIGSVTAPRDEGGSAYVIVIEKIPVPTLPVTSVAVHVTWVVPIGKTSPGEGVHVEIIE